MKSPGPALYLHHILESIELAESYVAGINYDQFTEDPRLQDAVVRRIAIIGEAVKKLPPELQQEHAGVPWRQIAGMRDKVIHDYMSVDVELIWRVVHQDFSGLAVAARALLDQLRTDQGIS